MRQVGSGGPKWSMSVIVLVSTIKSAFHSSSPDTMRCAARQPIIPVERPCPRLLRSSRLGVSLRLRHRRTVRFLREVEMPYCPDHDAMGRGTPRFDEYGEKIRPSHPSELCPAAERPVFAIPVFERPEPPQSTSGSALGRVGAVLLGCFVLVLCMAAYISHLFPDLPYWVCWGLGVAIPITFVVLYAYAVKRLFDAGWL
jgi:hypothetical protein